MSLVAARQGVRLIRPLLPIPGEHLKTYLKARGQTWLEDPSNMLARFERVRWRQGSEGILPSPAEIRAWGEARVIREFAVADLLSSSVTIHEPGFVLVDLSLWARTNPAILSQALGQLVAMVGGQDYLPGRKGLAGAADALLSGAPQRSLGGSLIGSWRGRGLVCREAAAATETVSVAGPGAFSWDRRFRINVTGSDLHFCVGALGENGLAEIGQKRLFRLKGGEIPAWVRASLPALRDATGRLIGVPHLGFDPYELASNVHFRFRPHYSATSSGFTVADR
jgi:tRNA(Ile)-lysidine synthase